MRSLPDLRFHCTRHAKGRMRWRRISAEEVRAVIEDPGRVERMDGKLRLMRTLGKRRLLVIVAVESDRIVVITVMDRR